MQEKRIFCKISEEVAHEYICSQHDSQHAKQSEKGLMKKERRFEDLHLAVQAKSNSKQNKIKA